MAHGMPALFGEQYRLNPPGEVICREKIDCLRLPAANSSHRRPKNRAARIVGLKQDGPETAPAQGSFFFWLGEAALVYQRKVTT